MLRIPGWWMAAWHESEKSGATPSGLHANESSVRVSVSSQRHSCWMKKVLRRTNGYALTVRDVVVAVGGAAAEVVLGFVAETACRGLRVLGGDGDSDGHQRGAEDATIEE